MHAVNRFRCPFGANGFVQINEQCPRVFCKFGQNQIVSLDQTSIDAYGSCKRAFRINWWDIGDDKLGSEEREAMQQRSVGLAKLLLSPGRGVRIIGADS